MRQRNFWDHFFEDENQLREQMRENLNSALDSVDILRDNVDGLYKSNQLLRKNVIQLGMTIDVLLDLLEERHVIDAGELDRRVNERRFPGPPAQFAGVGSPYRDGSVAEVPLRPAETMCSRCAELVPFSATHITEYGVVCDPCFATIVNA